MTVAAETQARVHATVCALPPAAWTDRCRCDHMQVRHRNAEHPAVSTGRGATCTGRNNAGACRECACPTFTNPTAEEATHA